MKLTCIKCLAQLLTSNNPFSHASFFLFLSREERVWLRPLTSALHPIAEWGGGILPLSLGGSLTQLRAPPPLAQLPKPVGALLKGSLEGRGPYLHSPLPFKIPGVWALGRRLYIGDKDD